MATNILRAGVVGLGVQARETLLRVLGAIPGVAVEGVADLDEELAASVARMYDVPRHYRSASDMIRMERGLDFLVVSVPHGYHAAEAIHALHSGVHVYVEKPMATTADAAEAMFFAAEARSLVLGGGSQFPWQLWKVLQLIGGERFGEIHKAECRFLVRDSIPDRPPFWKSPDDGGVVFDLDPHSGSVAVCLFGDVVGVTAKGSRERGLERCGPEFGAWDTTESTWRFAGGNTATLKASWDAEEHDISVCAEGPDVRWEIPIPSSELDPLPLAPILYRRGRNGNFDDGVKLFDCAPIPTEWAQLAHMSEFVDAVRSAGLPIGAPLRFGPSRVLAVQRGLNATLESLQSGREVSVR